MPKLLLWRWTSIEPSFASTHDGGHLAVRGSGYGVLSADRAVEPDSVVHDPEEAALAPIAAPRVGADPIRRVLHLVHRRVALWVEARHVDHRVPPPEDLDRVPPRLALLAEGRGLAALGGVHTGLVGTKVAVDRHLRAGRAVREELQLDLVHVVRHTVRPPAAMPRGGQVLAVVAGAGTNVAPLGLWPRMLRAVIALVVRAARGSEGARLAQIVQRLLRVAAAAARAA